jgi:hypothetical protein
MASEKRHVASEYTHQIGRIVPEGCRYNDVNSCGLSWNLAGPSCEMLLTD